MPIPADAVESFLSGGGDGGADAAPTVVARNAARVRAFLEKAGEDVLAGDVTWHRPAGGSVQALLDWRSSREIEIRRTIASGDSVLAQLDTHRQDRRQVTYAWFRPHDDRITDVWMVTQDFVGESEAATRHPHF
ncbi:MAG: hypothetical protein AAGA54_32610 [Myxococcota bacterium]